MLFVFMGHFGPIWREILPTGGLAGFYLAVIDADATFGSSFFMFLSSFFAYGSMMKASRKPGEFLRGRMFRLYPLYAAMCGVYIIGSFAFPSHSKLPMDPIAAVLRIAENLLFLPGVLPVAPLMDVAWTLSFIFFFYFIAAGISALFRRFHVSRTARFLILVSGGLLWASLICSLTGWQPRTAMFWTGMAAREMVDAVSEPNRARWATSWTVPAAILTVLGAVARTLLMVLSPDTGVVPILFWRFVITSITLVAFVWIAYFGPEWWKQALSNRQLCSLGAASYSFYLTHGFALKAFQYVLIPILGAAAASPFFFWTSQLLGPLMAIVIARVVFTQVETPLTNFVTRWIGPAPQKAEEAAPLPTVRTARDAEAVLIGGGGASTRSSV